MASIDSKVAAVFDNAAADDEDALIDALEEDPQLDAFREQRLNQLHAEFTRAKQNRNNDHGSYSEIKEEKSLMDITTSTNLCVVHFFKPDFNRCRIMDNHLDVLAPKHLDTRFLRIHVDNCPFLVAKLKIQVLPCVIGFVQGVGVDRIVGFEGLGRSADTFTTQDLEKRLVNCGALLRSKTTNEPKLRFHNASGRNRDHNPTEEDNDDDWD